MRKLACTALMFLAVASSARAGSVTHFDTVMGGFDVELYDAATPITVTNFLSYVTSGRYDGTFIHRAVPGFVVQGGGYYYDSASEFPVHIPTDPPIINEGTAGRPNVRGTISMARLAGDLNSATSEFFFNSVDNSANLDAQSFVVFGQVLGSGMDVIDAISALQNVNAGGTFQNLPVRNYSGGQITEANLVIVNSITLIPAPASAALLVGILTIGARRRRL